MTFNRWTALYLALSGALIVGAYLAMTGNRLAGMYAGGSVLVHVVTDVVRTMRRR